MFHRVFCNNLITERILNDFREYLAISYLATSYFAPLQTAVKNHVIRYCERVYERSGKNLFWSIKNSGEVFNKLKSRGFRATSLSTYDFSTLYTSFCPII